MEETLFFENEFVKMKVICNITNNSLHIRYVVYNHHLYILYLYNKLYKGFKDKSYLVDNQLSYVLYNDKYVSIGKYIAPVPDGMGVAVKIVPCVTKILPNSMFSEEFLIDLPLTLYSPYVNLNPDKKHITSRLVFFSIGYIFGNERSISYEKYIDTSYGKEIFLDGSTYKNQQFLTVGPLQNKLPIYQFME